MKKAFTLVELLIVVVVIVTLMGITFRLSGVGSDSAARNITVNRLQRLENCLSGYYAAYGSYPPVKLHGSRDFTYKVDMHGIQRVDSDEHESELIWDSVKAACQSQPIGMSYPFNKKSAKDYVATMSTMLLDQNPGNALFSFEALVDNSTVSGKKDEVEWTRQQIFKFGVLSYLLPRYLLIMGGDADNGQIFTEQASWRLNNQLPPQFENGIPYTSWNDVNTQLRDESSDRWKVAALPSQSTCVRWLPNLEKCLTTIENKEVYGIELRDPDDPGTSPLGVYAAGDSQNASQQFMTDRITIRDGWGTEFFYYSPPPHQSYRVWSAGKNTLTFPPWLTDEELKEVTDKYKTMKHDNGTTSIQDVVADDIVQMSN